jgi:hypothetical protein
LFSELIRHRYKLFPDERIRNQLLSEVHHFSTLRHLVVAILSEEAGFLDNPLENQILFQNIISEELLKKKVPSTLTYITHDSSNFREWKQSAEIRTHFCLALHRMAALLLTRAPQNEVLHH